MSDPTIRKPFFVMRFNHDRTRIEPMVDNVGNMLMYASRKDASGAADNTLYGKSFGYEIFKVERLRTNIEPQPSQP